MDDGASIHSGVSHAPSMHPSLAGTVMSKACSEVTIGAGDNTGYWYISLCPRMNPHPSSPRVTLISLPPSRNRDYQHRSATRSDLGHNCRECRLPFNRVGEAITERRGARVSMRYHAECFSGFADPRSQATSSHHIGALAGMQLEAAPHRKAGGKMRAGQHFDSGSDSRFQQQESSRQSAGGKMAGLGMHSGGFGARSSKPREGAGAQVREPARAPGDLTEEALAEHLRVQSIQEDVES
jgi:hypothetical protein